MKQLPMAMRRKLESCAGSVTVLAAVMYLAPVAHSQMFVSSETLSFKAETAFEPGADIKGELRVPEPKRIGLPAVVIVHGSAGIDGRGSFYADALNQAGLATFEIELWRLAEGGGPPVSARFKMPHIYGAMLRLSRDPRIDPARIGIIGFSWGGIVAGLTSSAELTQQYTGGKTAFAAHLGLYPVCWSHRSVLDGQAKHFGPATYRQVTGKPVHFLAGDNDDYDAPDECTAFIAALPEDARRYFSLTVYPGATHGWDSRFGGSFDAWAANRGKGGSVTVVADPEMAKRSRAFAVAFFVKHLGAAGN